MAKSKSAKKTKKIINSDIPSIVSASAVLFAGACIILIGNIQGVDNLNLLMVGFGTALLVIGGVLLGNAAKTSK